MKHRSKRRSNDSLDREYDAARQDYAAGDDPIGLTQAFAPVSADDGYADADGSGTYTANDDPIGLTQAFGPVSGAAEHDAPAADEDSAAPAGGEAASATGEGAPAAPAEAPGDAAQAADGTAQPFRGSHARGFSYRGDDRDDYPDALETLEPLDKPPLLVNDRMVDSLGSDARHSAPAEEPPHVKRSRRVRKALVVVIVILIALVAALLFFGYHAIREGNSIASQQAQSRSSLTEATGNDASTANSRTTEVPNLTSLLGKTQDDAVSQLGHGATVTSTRTATDDGSAVKTSVSVALTTEPTDTKVGVPTVYLGLDDAGSIIQVGYSASASALGFGTQSFADAVNSQHVVEKTLSAIGVSISEGSAQLPSDKSQYTTYASDGTTVTRERCSFTGDTTVNGAACTWSSVLAYDYTTANLTGDLSDTVRVIYAYVTENVAASSDGED